MQNKERAISKLEPSNNNTNNGERTASVGGVYPKQLQP
jgi:hypothetical protein